MARIVVFADYFHPGWRAGGPILSIDRQIQSETAHTFLVVTRCHDLGSRERYPELNEDKLVEHGRAQVLYVSTSPISLFRARWEISRFSPDIYYFNSVFSRPFTLLPMVARFAGLLPPASVVVAPRGELFDHARKIHGLRKKLISPLIRHLMRQTQRWHASSISEAKVIGDFVNAGRRHAVETVIIPDHSPAPDREIRWKAAEHTGASPRIVFSGRVHPIKGVQEAITLLANIRIPLRFDVYGPIQDDRYWRELQKAATSMLPPGTLQYKGTYRPSEAQQIFRDATLLLFPTHSENFGHVIAEALSVGCPVAIPPTTPWTETVNQGGGFLLNSTCDDSLHLMEFLQQDPAEMLQARVEALRAYSNWFAACGGTTGVFDNMQGESRD